MATQLPDYQWTKQRPASTPRASLPDEWFDGQAWLLTLGEDFDTKVSSIRSRFGAEAKRRGLYARTKVVSDGEILVKVQAEPVRAPKTSAPLPQLVQDALDAVVMDPDTSEPF